MTYLFQQEIQDSGIENSKNLQRIEGDFVNKTAELQVNYPRIQDNGFEYDEILATERANSMFKNGKELSPYVQNWQQASNNKYLILNNVKREFRNAYDLNIDITKDEVIGSLFGLATQAWSYGEYTNALHDNQTR